MKILVTGATGFLGKAIVGELVRGKNEVFTTGRSLSADALPNYYAAELSAPESLRELEKLGKFDAVVHAAGLAHQFKSTNEENFRRVNVEGTRNVAELAAILKVEEFILISSVAVYGTAAENEQAPQFEETQLCQPRGFYAQSKYEAEKAADVVCKQSSISLTILRPATIIGEGDRGNVARLIEAIDKKRFFWIGDGANLKSLIYKGDVARACATILQANKGKFQAPRIYNVAAEPVSMREIVLTIAETLGSSPPNIHLPPSFLQTSLALGGKITGLNFFKKTSETIAKWLSDEVFSGAKMREEIGFQAELSVREALRREVLDYRKRK